ncbi:MAG TPA: dihydrolipoamide acetyltransferase family protein [Terriglobales bacterium]|jgi:pyruvate dehydrogenase E2 component (dihydrolipoamide acetyltransferase)|nr:dihydrolipoamide acetyltransferase family protein [Terriglobales bacterium]
MAISVVMPALEMAQETGKLISWLKKEGESVAKGEPLLEIETDKAVMEIESPAAGVLAGIKVEAGTEVPVGRTIAWIVRPGEVPPTDEGPAASGRKTTAAVSSAISVSESANQASPAMQSATQPIKISPKARRLAIERGVNLSEVRGSGPGGEILASDIVAAGESKASVPPAKTASGSPVSRLMAERTTQSWTTVPHFFVVREADAGALNEVRLKFGPAIEQSLRVKLTHSDLLVALVALVLQKHPRINSSWTSEGIRANSQINIGLAVAVDDGVVAPVIHNAGQAELGKIALQRRDLTERARGGKLRTDDITGGTFTISNLGMFGVDAFTAIIIPPQAAILAVGAITDRVVPVSGLPGIRPMMTLTLSSDHRVVDGARAADFLRDLVEAILNPLQYFKNAGNVD